MDDFCRSLDALSAMISAELSTQKEQRERIQMTDSLLQVAENDNMILRRAVERSISLIQSNMRSILDGQRLLDIHRLSNSRVDRSIDELNRCRTEISTLLRKDASELHTAAALRRTELIHSMKGVEESQRLQIEENNEKIILCKKHIRELESATQAQLAEIKQQAESTLESQLAVKSHSNASVLIRRQIMTLTKENHELRQSMEANSRRPPALRPSKKARF